MHELASPLSSASDLEATYATRKHEAREALDRLIRLGAAATDSAAAAVALIDGDIERSVATWCVPAYATARTSGFSGLLTGFGHTLNLPYAQTKDAGLDVPNVDWTDATVCARQIHSRWGADCGVIWMVREGSREFSVRDIEIFEQSVALVERELGFLARQEDIIVQRERATVEVAELHEQLQSQHSMYRALARHLPDTAVLIFDAELRVRLNEGRHSIPLLASVASIGLGQHVALYFPAESASRIDAACREALIGNQQLLEIHSAGHILEVSVGPLEDSHANELGLAIVRDVTESRRKHEQSTSFGTRLQALVQNLDDGILVEDENRRVQLCSTRLCDIMRLDVPCEVHIGCDGSELATKMASICFIPEAFEESTAQLVVGNVSNRRELIYLADMRIIERDYSPLSVLQRPVGHLWVYRDVTQREQSKDLLQRQADQLRALSLVDELTGLYNRRGFLTLATQQLKLCDRTLRPALVVFVDLDGMKRINDELGHEFGDQALVETASTMRQCFRYSDVLARLGGDEFVALAIDAAEDTVAAIQARLYEKLAELNSKPDRPFELRFSIGMAPYDPSRAEMIEEVLARADSLMYEQKRAKRAARK